MSEECDTRVGEEVGPTRLVGGGKGPVEVGLPVGRCGFGLWLCGPERRTWSNRKSGGRVFFGFLAVC